MSHNSRRTGPDPLHSVEMEAQMHSGDGQVIKYEGCVVVEREQGLGEYLTFWCSDMIMYSCLPRHFSNRTNEVCLQDTEATSDL